MLGTVCQPKSPSGVELFDGEKGLLNPRPTRKSGAWGTRDRRSDPGPFPFAFTLGCREIDLAPATKWMKRSP
jgi:hypothetical protein